MSQKIMTSLWFDTQAEDAATFYTALFPNSRITEVSRWGEGGPGQAGTAISVNFQLEGQEFNAINGGPAFSFTEATSLTVHCADQAEVDRYWNALTADGGEESQCGWLMDKYGLSWQIIPDALPRLLGDPDPKRAGAAMQAMFTMRKLDVAALEAAADGATVAA